VKKILDLIIKVTDEASKELAEVQGTAGGGGKGVLGLSEGLLSATAAATLAAGAIYKVGQEAYDALEDWQEHVFKVDALADAFGLTVEEAEELIIISDRFNISNDALFSTMNKLAAAGYGTGTEALAKMRDEFLMIADPAEAAAWLFGLAGEQGQKVLGPLLTMSDLDFQDFIASMDGAGSVTEDMVADAWALEQATEGMRLAWQNLKLELATWAAPGVTSFLEAMLDFIEYKPEDWGEYHVPVLSRGIQGTWDQISDPNSMTSNLLAGAGDVYDAIVNLPNTIKDAIERSPGP